MHIFYGLLMAVIGLILLAFSTLGRDIVVYRWLVAIDRYFWGDRVHRFHQFSGVILVVLGLLWAFGVIWSGS